MQNGLKVSLDYNFHFSFVLKRPIKLTEGDQAFAQRY